MTDRLVGGRIASTLVPSVAAVAVSGPAPVHSINSGVNQKRQRKERRGKKRLRGS